MLREYTAVDGQTVRLCDFGSAGEGGTPNIHGLIPAYTGMGYLALAEGRFELLPRPGPGVPFSPVA